MEKIINSLSAFLADTIATVLTSLYHNWLPLSLAILTAVLMKVYVNAEKLKQKFLERPKVSIVASVAFGAFTPLCACGTTAVVIGLLSTAIPWGPVMAFITSSPLMSPDGFIMIAGVIDLKFAIALAISSLIIGFTSGGLTHLIERNTDFLKGQLRFTDKSKVQACACNTTKPAFEQTISQVSSGCCQSLSLPKQVTMSSSCACSATIGATTIIKTQNNSKSCSCSSSNSIPDRIEPEAVKSNLFTNFLERNHKKIKYKEIGEAFISVGLKQILLYFTIFVAIGYMIQSFVPTSLIISLFSGDSIFSVPLAALIGLPLYVSGEGAIPLIKALMDGGAGAGAMLAFMITGPATSAWVIAGITTFMKRRAIVLYIGFILVGGIVLGYIYQFLLAMGL